MILMNNAINLTAPDRATPDFLRIAVSFHNQYVIHFQLNSIIFRLGQSYFFYFIQFQLITKDISHAQIGL